MVARPAPDAILPVKEEPNSMTHRPSRAGALIALALALAVAVTGCARAAAPPAAAENPGSAGSDPAAPQTLVLYSGRRDALVKPVLEAFSAATGIEVHLRSGGASELANAILEERRNPQADVFIANDAGTLEKLRLEGVLEPYLSDRVKAIPADLRASDGAWVGVSARARVIMYNATLLSEAAVPKTIAGLADPAWQGKVAMAQSSNESVIAHVTAIRLLAGDGAARALMEGLLRNRVAFLGGHTQVRQAVGKGEFALGFVNHYYYFLEKADGSPVGIVWPDQGPGDRGVVINVAGAAVVKGAKNAAAAQRFIDFLLAPDAQDLFARLNYEIPTLPGVPTAEGVPSLTGLKRAPVPLERLGQELDATLDLIEAVGF